MNAIPPPRHPGSTAPLDELDAAVLADVRAYHELTDPPPADLTERIKFAIAIEDFDVGDAGVVISRLQEDQLVGSGARGSERSRTVTFDSDSLTIMVTVAEDGAENVVRLDGWLAPPGPLRVELRITREPATSRGESYAVTADDTGRFVFDGVARGLAQLVVHPTPDCGVDLATRVITPALLL